MKTKFKKYIRALPVFRKRNGEYNFSPFGFYGTLQKGKNSFLRIEILNVQFSFYWTIEED
jgi:hypothetical protein